MAMQEPGRTKGFPCKHCGIVCSNMPSLLEHMESHFQQEEDRKFKCNECGRGYRHAGSLVNHKKTHELGSFQCPICARKLSNPLALKSHLRIHTSQKKYSCTDCGKAFRLATQLATHEKVHLFRQSKGRAGRRADADYSLIENTDEIQDNDDLDEQSVLPAEQQDSVLDSISESDLHQEAIPISVNDSENLGFEEVGDRPFRCDQCEKSYRHHGSLINHKKSHQVGTFECPICFKQLNNLAALHSHQRTHNKSKSGPERSVEVLYAATTPEQFSPPNREAPVHFCHLCQVMFPNDEEFQEHIQMHNSSSMSFGHNQDLPEDHHVSYDDNLSHSPDSNFYTPPLNSAPSIDHQGEQINNVQIYSDHSSRESLLNAQGEPSVLDSEISADDLNKAEQSRFTENGERRFKCQICGKSYRHAGSLINHKRSHQTGIFQCSICRKTYPHMAALRSHVRIHKAHPSSFNLNSEGDWLSTEPLTLENQQACFSSQDGNVSSMMSITQENTDVRDKGGLFHDQFDSAFPQGRTAHLPHDEHLMERHMCADCGETFADIAGIKSHVCPFLQQQQETLSNDYNCNLTFQETNGQCTIGNPGDHVAFQRPNGVPEQKYFGEHDFNRDINGEQFNGGDGKEEDDVEDDEDDGELYQCSVCGNRYTSMRALRSHLRGHTQSRGTPTSSGPSSMSSLEAEKEEDSGESQQMDAGLMICSTCGESFAKKQDLLAHQLLHNEAQADDVKHVHVDNSDETKPKEEVDSIICGNCGIFCTSYHHLETHQCTTNRKSESANNIGDSVNTKVLGHMKENLDNGDRQYKCDQCGRAYRHAGSLLNHKKSHKTGVFRCAVCQKRFYNLLALKNHQRTHFDVKRHTCNECGKAFKIQKQLLNHLRIHKENQAKIQELNNQIQALMQMNGTVSEGGMTSLNAPAHQPATATRKKRRTILIRKKNCVEGSSQTTSVIGVKSEEGGDPRPYSCDQCGRTYRHAGSLVNHKNSHKTGEYYCSVCNNTYSNQLAMKNHLRIHFSVKKHSCQDCGKAFRGKKQLSIHVCAHLRKDTPGGVRGRGRRRAKNIKCKQCRLTFMSSEQLTAHTCGSLGNPTDGSDGQMSTALKKEERPFTCSICSRSYRHAGSLLNHKNTHKSGHFSCTFCSKPFSNPMALRNHTRIHTQKKKHICLTCGKAFRLASILHNHQKVHTRVASHFSCPECGKSFQGKSGLKRHRCQRSHDDSATVADNRESADKCFTCDLCGRSYRHAGSLLNHKKTHSENLHHCTLCLQTFPDPFALQVHSEMKRHCCPDCGKTFCLIAHLQNHMEVHSKDRTLICSPCHQSFPNPASYQHHQDLHHRTLDHYPQQNTPMEEDLGWSSELDQTVGLQGMPKLLPAFAHMHGVMPGPQLQQDNGEVRCTDEKSHVCEHCGRTYRHAGSLLNHKNSHKTGSFFCSVCQKEFTNLMALKNHRRIHTEPKRYQCLECGKAFRVSTQLICHRRIHTKEKPFSCLLCDKRFSSKSNLRHHQKMHQSGAQAYESSFDVDTSSFMDLDMGSFL
ncbi:zinc finger protein 646 [Esox lucius]|uniref:C2H2-type domain-containing protein n=1 Tax=Esox lucius TaxID=8010 RepID=A0A3P8ZV66_ESOLU|nr:zinc finger protein 646 [Esox lucius]XP_010887186.3 zinc finger protein 646 [Esox lucius]XP_010887187.3 zinc finger protein 646 [Esox lucius]XP_019902252.3 zinc finger protein 646 [Esox lucius]